MLSHKFARFPTNIFYSVTIFAIATPNALAAPDREASYSFIETTGGTSAALFFSPPKIVIEEEATKVTICEKNSDLYCFQSEQISFAVPRERGSMSSWKIDGRIYCVIRHQAETGRKTSQSSNILLIFSGTGASCESDSNFDTSAVYSEAKGLRLIYRQFPNGRLIELYSIDEIGFGAKGK